jgi:tetratricopeptide (TPR) repeat protein
MEVDIRVKREKSAKAVALALEGRWEEATVLNRELLERFPQDVETLNRLGKAYLEMGRYSMARGAFGAAVAVAPHNTIAKKNLYRLENLPNEEEDEASPPPSSTRVMPNLFIEDSGKSGVTVLHKPASGPVLAKVAPGELVDLRAEERRLTVHTPQGQLLGEVEPKLANRLLRLIRQGNRYSGAVVSVQPPRITVALREVYTHPSLLGIASFPSKSRAGYAPQLPQAYARLDLDQDVEDEHMPPEWNDAYDSTVDGEVRSAVGQGYDDDEDEGE